MQLPDKGSSRRRIRESLLVPSVRRPSLCHTERRAHTRPAPGAQAICTVGHPRQSHSHTPPDSSRRFHAMTHTPGAPAYNTAAAPTTTRTTTTTAARSTAPARRSSAPQAVASSHRPLSPIFTDLHAPVPSRQHLHARLASCGQEEVDDDREGDNQQYCGATTGYDILCAVWARGTAQRAVGAVRG